ncbi:hypothetical protein [Flagellimonas aequoris]|uniref:Uncharacterized protein n=1 Tax=Flagellimonas aequoris TaxID=2306997 RepID=A0ABY3KSX6_9FLAO|nr:hypothetical protein [Allomuricauda aequoris]TXK01943.1 hypothetical protein FQ019_08970 [Allomuricauda aequoris]
MIISGEVDKIDEYLDLGEDVKSKPEYLTFFKENFMSLKNTMVEGCNLDYEVLTMNEARDLNVNDIVQYEKNYSKFEQVYFVVCNGKIILPIIEKDNRIISFQSSMLKKLEHDYTPFLLNQ